MSNLPVGRRLGAAGAAAWNMALDEALLEIASSAPCLARAAPILRFYEWKQPAVTLGRFQDAAASVDLCGCRRAAIEVVRRPTGGRAVYHHTDLTFSLILPETGVGGRSVRESYRLLLAAIGEALARLTLEVREGAQGAPGPRSHPDCFARGAPSDLILRDQKVLGSAQMRRSGWILQQGSIRLWPLCIPRGLFYDQDDHHVEYQPPADPALTKQAVALAIQHSLGAALGWEWQESHLEPEERERTAQLEREKYRTNDWNLFANAPQTVPQGGPGDTVHELSV